MGDSSTNAAYVEAVPLEIKILASLRRLGRGEAWDTITELCNDLCCAETLRSFFTKFTRTMIHVFGDEWIHPPRTQEEIESVVHESTRRGYPGCLGFMDGVHVQWDMCPTLWRHLSIGKDATPSIGWQCTVNHKRRFVSVGKAHLGSVNDKTACRYDDFVKELRQQPMYNSAQYKLFRDDGTTTVETGLWLSVDGGYISMPELLVGDPSSLDHYMNFWNHFMESERKHVECAFGILKARFRILKLPIHMHDFDEIDDMFHTCCILHNMCLEFDGHDDDWNLGDSLTNGHYGPEGLHFGDFVPGDDGLFSDDEHHEFYSCEGMYYDITPDIDYTIQYNMYFNPGSMIDKRYFLSKRDKIAKNWYYMYKKHMLSLKK